MESRASGTVVEITIDDKKVYIDERLSESIDALSLSPRAQKCLNRATIYTVGALVKKSKGTLLMIPNFGENTLDEVVQALEVRGLSLALIDG